MGKMKLLRDVVDNLHGLADSISCMADAIEEPKKNSNPDVVTQEQAEKNADSLVKDEEDARVEPRKYLSAISLAAGNTKAKALILKYNANTISGVSKEQLPQLLIDAKMRWAEIRKGMSEEELNKLGVKNL